jgi:HD-like signal output (HDOD) protein
MHSLIDQANRQDGCPKALVRAIESRPELASWVLKTLNSERFSLSRQLKSLQQAIVEVGLNTVRHLVLVMVSAVCVG